MKPQTLLRLSLLLPYLLWGFSVVTVLIMSSAINASMGSGNVFNALAFIVIIYAYWIILWGLPYTLLAIGLWIWSLHKQTRNIIKTFTWAPVLLTIPMMIETLILDYRSYNSYSELTQNWQSFWSGFAYSTLTLTGLSLAYGYLCIGLVYVLYKLLGKLKLIQDEQEQLALLTN